MKINIIRTAKTIKITRDCTSGGGQSLRKEVREIAMVHDQWIVEWKDSKPLTNQEMKNLKAEMLQLATEAGLI